MDLIAFFKKNSFLIPIPIATIIVLAIKEHTFLIPIPFALTIGIRYFIQLRSWSRLIDAIVGGLYGTILSYIFFCGMSLPMPYNILPLALQYWYFVSMVSLHRPDTNTPDNDAQNNVRAD